MLGRRLLVTAWHVVMLVTILVTVFPVLWAVVTSFKGPGEVYSTGIVADSPTLENYAYVFEHFPLVRLLTNTLITAVCVAGGQVAIAALAAYALVHLVPERRGLWLTLVTIALIVPAQALIIPQFLLAAAFDWQNTLYGLIIPQLTACALPVLILVQNLRELPTSHVLAARVDGARSGEILFRILLPEMATTMAAVFVLQFISTWNEYLWPLLIAGRIEHTTVQMGLNMFITTEGNDYGGLMAAAVVTALPVVAVYLLAARHINAAFMRAAR